MKVSGLTLLLLNELELLLLSFQPPVLELSTLQLWLMKTKQKNTHLFVQILTCRLHHCLVLKGRKSQNILVLWLCFRVAAWHLSGRKEKLRNLFNDDLHLFLLTIFNKLDGLIYKGQRWEDGLGLSWGRGAKKEFTSDSSWLFSWSYLGVISMLICTLFTRILWAQISLSGGVIVLLLLLLLPSTSLLTVTQRQLVFISNPMIKNLIRLVSCKFSTLGIMNNTINDINALKKWNERPQGHELWIPPLHFVKVNSL